MASTSSLEGRVTRAERQNVLLGAYGFQCRCDACALDDALVEKEDQLRREVTYSPRLGESSFKIDVGQKPTMYRPGSWPSQSVVGNLNFWQGLNVSFRSGFNSSLRFSKIFYVKKEVVQTWDKLDTKSKTWCIWRLAGVRILQMLNDKTSAYPPTWHLGCGLGTCPTCWTGRAGCPGRF